MTSVAGPSRSSPITIPASEVDSRRTSLVSGSAASYHTAFVDNSPSQSSMHSAISNASGHTIGVGRSSAFDGTEVNPINLLSQGSQEIQVYTMHAESVQLRAGAFQESLLTHAGKTTTRIVSCDQEEALAPSASAIGPPPPSPPPSVEHERDDDTSTVHQRAPSPTIGFSRSEPQSQPGASSLSTPSPRKLSFGAPVDPSSATQPGDVLRQRASTETRFSARTGTGSTTGTTISSTATPSMRTLRTSDESSTPATSEQPTHSSKGSHVSIDGHLQPPQLGTHRPARRNTTGSAATSLSARPSKSSPLQHRHGQALDDTDAYTAAHSASHAQMLGLTPGPDGALGFGELDTDILLQADQIRRERTAKRRQQEQQEAEMAALSKATSKDDNKVLVGNLIGEDHANYVLMYNMLTGIRIGVSSDMIFLFSLPSVSKINIDIDTLGFSLSGKGFT